MGPELFLHNASSLVRSQLPCFEFVLLPFLGNCTDCRQLTYTGNDAPEPLSAKPSLHVTIPGVVVVGVQFVKSGIEEDMRSAD